VNQFEIHRYLGQWYEMARLNHRFERGMQKVTANYTLKDNGDIAVVNRGFLTDKQTWKEATGNARFVDKKDQGHLKVSFFGPFYGSYIVFELDKEDYQYAFVTSTSRDYLWFLSRTPSVSDELMQHFMSTATRLGFDTDQLIVVEH
jgi:apolipoprotein D and lipocalin family protein